MNKIKSFLPYLLITLLIANASVVASNESDNKGLDHDITINNVAMVLSLEEVQSIVITKEDIRKAINGTDYEAKVATVCLFTNSYSSNLIMNLQAQEGYRFRGGFILRRVGSSMIDALTAQLETSVNDTPRRVMPEGTDVEFEAFHNQDNTASECRYPVSIYLKIAAINLERAKAGTYRIAYVLLVKPAA